MKNLATMAQPLAKKSLGQNFLQDRNISEKIVQLLHIDRGDRVVEIGPGPGALTEIIAAAAPAHLLLIEKDEHWATQRRDVPVASGSQPEVLCADALEVAWEDFAAPWKCIGNLPYNVASPLMWEIFSRAEGLSRAVFMIQKEVGQRITALPGTKAYGALSVWIQSFMTAKIAFIVPPQVFIPRPKVESAVLSFAPLAERPSREEATALAALLHRCFQQRRKQLGTILKGLPFGEGDLPVACGIRFSMRPEEISPARFMLLARLSMKAGGVKGKQSAV